LTHKTSHMNDLEARIELITACIHKAFAGVVLGDGVSLRQSIVVDNYGEGYTDAEFDQIKLIEVVDDWTQIPRDELMETENIAHFDAGGFRYYIPALMLALIERHDSGSLRVIGTLGSLYPKQDHTWTHYMDKYSLLSYDQKQAIAKYLIALPDLISLDTEDKTIVERAIRNYWSEFLPIYIPIKDEFKNI
jgi:hypothetical protein